MRTPQGTDLRFQVNGRQGNVDDGLYGESAKRWGNLPAGEAYIIPLEGTGEGTLLHEDFVQPDVDLILDGRQVIATGEWV